MPESPPPSTHRAVFVSYAREDTTAARRIADALTAFGIEVWFDQSELRGGDQWDAKIKKQIRDCALFLPLVSSQTQARAEGYFRREWRLAVERTHDMSAGVAFIVPVVIDETREAEADVPEEFMRYQWTRLAHGVPSPQFVEQIKRLLDAPRQAAAHSRPTPGASPVPAASASGFPKWIVAALAGALVAVVAYVVVRPGAKNPAPAGKPVAEAKPSPAPTPVSVPAVNEKSIAVLPFVNRSTEKETEFFTDGVHEDILTNLAHIRELRVISRTSVAEYRNTSKKIPQIARELGVAYVLEGSVQRSGKNVRVTGQLIRAATDEHVWAQSYDRDLTDVFSIQSELAKAIAKELRAAISPEETKHITRRPTESLAAYDLFLKAREKTRAGSADRFDAEQLLESAVNIDPRFADAWLLLAYVQAFNSNSNRTPGRTAAQIEKAARSMEMVQRLLPGTPAALRAEGDFQLYCRHDIPLAAELFERALRLDPNDADTIKQLSAAERRLGRWGPMVTHVRQYLDLEPSDTFVLRTFVTMLLGGRRYAEAEVVSAQLLKTMSADLQDSFRATLIPFWKSGSKREAEDLFARWTRAQCESAAGMTARIDWALISGDLPETSVPSATGGAKLSWAELGGNIGERWELAVFLAARGDIAGVRAATDRRRESLRAQLAKTPEVSVLWAQLGEIEALRGNREEALQCAQKAHQIRSEAQGMSAESGRVRDLAFILTWTNDKDGAIAEYARLLSSPQELLAGPGGKFESIYTMRASPRHAPLRGDPRFEALLNDPKNNEPLF